MEERVYFRNGLGYRLSGLLRRPPAEGKHPLVIGCHGFGSKKDSPISAAIVQHLERLGVASFRLSFTGHDDSEGDIAQVTVSSGVADLRAAVGFLDQYDRVDSAAIGLLGHSYGGTVALRYAATSDIPRCLALLAPVSDYVAVKQNKLGPDGIREWQARGYTVEDTDTGSTRLNYTFYEDACSHDSYELAKRIQADCLIYHGDEDEAVPLDQSLALAETLGQRAELRVVHQGKHGFDEPSQLETVAREVGEFFRARLLDAPRLP